ncbi:GDSL-type esterase/lipase family protein [Pseudalkalibacillus berkeleyi]|uniref:GDSL-type esterase/lipase family protein n=1 Tax=Pseudalkalibacillus berkeleyi TaxID=1069813 RepID=A0ABS9GWS3_9BACL|nr:GDSL-type esterase/lipase family protein [Pseudalkalibacillus berkeleyi]MCF6137252.1 GDSL-type esterase/lipase family protein [Pseudalkalibacillus berkeleyi]
MNKIKWILLILIPLVFVVGILLFINKEEPDTDPVIGPILDDPLPDKENEEEPPKDEEEKEEKKKDDNKPEEVTEDVIEDVHIVGLGDSLTKGSGDKTKGGYIHPVAQHIQENSDEPVSLKNFGIHGLPSSKLVKKVEEEKVREHIKQADHVFITIGGNDILNIVEYNFFSLDMDVFETGKQRYRKNMFVIVQTIRALNPDANIYVLGMFNPFHNFFQDIKEIDGVIDEWNQTAELVTDINEKTQYIPIDDLFLEEGSDHLFSNDKLHPNQKGYIKMANRVQEYLDLPENE